jgi:hypothetical protein
MRRLKQSLLWSTIILGVIGFSGFGEAAYWNLARPFSVVLLVLYLTFRSLEAEMDQFEQDQETRKAAIRASRAAEESARSHVPRPRANEPQQASRAA